TAAMRSARGPACPGPGPGSVDRAPGPVASAGGLSDRDSADIGSTDSVRTPDVPAIARRCGRGRSAGDGRLGPFRRHVAVDQLPGVLDVATARGAEDDRLDVRLLGDPLDGFLGRNRAG